MSLAEVQLALKTIIMESPEIPNEEKARVIFYQNLFPKLTKIELEDLAKNDPSKFKIYTTSIFAAQRSFIKRNFPATLFALEKAWEKRYSEDLNLIQFLKKLFRTHPWQSTDFVDLGYLFLAYLEENFADNISLINLAKYELLTREVRRVKDDKFSAKDSVLPSELAALTVGEMLELQAIIPTPARFAEFSCDVFALKNYWSEHKALPVEIKEAQIFATACRDVNNKVSWEQIDRAEYSFISSKSNSQAFSLNDFAERFLLSAKEKELPLESEAETFKAFLQLISRLVSSGLLIIQRQ